MENDTVYVVTGDIPAMWLRDSAAQLRPYIFLAKENEEVRELIAGLVRRQFFCICIDEYANAFNDSPTRIPGFGNENLRWILCAIPFSLRTSYGRIQAAPPSLTRISKAGYRRF